MRILVGKTFGIGNAVMAVPMLKALKSMGHQVDVLVGSTPDDGGALDVMVLLRDQLQVIDDVYVNNATGSYDLAIMSIPFDGRWQNGVHFKAAKVMDGRTRPDPSTTGLVSWHKHEVEYQMDNAYELGYKGEVPDCSFMAKEEWALRPRVFYLGVGYKKDAAGFWKVKHWGNENYAELVKRVLAENPMNTVYTSGDMADLQLSINPIMKLVNDPRFRYQPGGITQSFRLIARCGTYFGNDTGMMHVAAACGQGVAACFLLQNSMTKSRPWCKTFSCIEGFEGIYETPRKISVDEFFEEVKDVTDGWITTTP